MEPLKIFAALLGIVCIAQFVGAMYLIEIIQRKTAALEWVREFGNLFPAQQKKVDDMENGIYE
jgi:hypothetical protein